MNFKVAIERLIQGQKLTEAEAYDVMLAMGKGSYNNSQAAALTITLSSRLISVDELKGCRRALLDLCVPAENLHAYNTIDLCGTGGDGKDTFNISTLSAFVVAAAGYKVAKHGNYGVSSISGSSNVLEQMGYRFSNNTDKLEKELDTLNICFLHAPLFHPALKNVAEIRKQLGIKTLFNILGPLVNPAQTKNQITGVFSVRLARLYHYLLQQDRKNYAVIHSTDGYDEVSLTGRVQLFSSSGERFFIPEEIGLKTVTPESLHGGNTLEQAAKIFKSILKGNGTDAQNSVVAANAGIAIHCFEPNASVQDCIAKAAGVLKEKRAYQLLEKLINQQ